MSLLKSRFGLPVAVGFDCRRHLVSCALPSVCFCNNLQVQSLVFPLLLLWVPVTVGLVLRGDVKYNYELRV